MSDEQNSAPVSEVNPEASAEIEDSLESIEAEGQEAPKAKENKAEAKAAAKAQEKLIKSLEVKYNNKVKKVDLDLNNEDELKSYISKALGAEEKFNEGANYRKQAEQLVDALQKNPLSILKNPALGIDIKQLAEMILNEQLEEAALSPEQKRIKELESAIAEREAKEKEEMTRKEKEEQERLTREQFQKIESEMISALDKSDLSASPYTVRRVSDIMASLIESGYEDITIEKVMPLAESIIMKELGQHMEKNRSPDRLEKIINKDILKDYRKHKVSQVKKAPKLEAPDTGTSSKDAQQSAQPKRVRISDIAGW